MRFIKTYENFNNEMIYHGTSLNSWNRTEDNETSLYLSNNEKDAENYAYETAASDEINELKPEPIVCSITMNQLKNLDLIFEPDWGAYGVTDDSTWEDTYKSSGCFSVFGNIDSIKTHFKIREL